MKFLTGLVVIVVGAAHAEEIPLKEIWAYNMPGTQELTDTQRDGAYTSEHGAVVRQIRNALDYDPDRKKASPAFIVSGSLSDALQSVVDKLDEKHSTDTKSIFKQGQHYLVFFGYQSGVYLHLQEVERTGSLIVLRYRLVPHGTREATSHFALIPLGDLPPGSYRVQMESLPLTEDEKSQGFSELGKGWNNRMVSRPFQFQIIANESKD